MPSRRATKWYSQGRFTAEHRTGHLENIQIASSGATTLWEWRSCRAIAASPRPPGPVHGVPRRVPGSARAHPPRPAVTVGPHGSPHSSHGPAVPRSPRDVTVATPPIQTGETRREFAHSDFGAGMAKAAGSPGRGERRGPAVADRGAAAAEQRAERRNRLLLAGGAVVVVVGVVLGLVLAPGRRLAELVRHATPGRTGRLSRRTARLASVPRRRLTGWAPGRA